jgi:hypothetical protein
MRCTEVFAVLGLVLLLILGSDGRVVCADSVLFEMFPYYEQDVVPVPFDQPWGYVFVSVENNIAHFEVGIFNAIMGYFQPGFEPQVEFFFFNYDKEIQKGDIIFNSSLSWVTNPVDTLAGSRGEFNYQVFVGSGLGEQILSFDIHNVSSDVTTENFLRTVQVVGNVYAEFRISMNNIAPIDGGVSGMHLVNRPILKPDADDDGIPDAEDVCPDTVIPESVPTKKLGVNRFALTDGDTIFDACALKDKGPQKTFTIEDTAGCSCEQIIAILGLGKGHTKFGCSIGAMKRWIKMVNP